MGEAADELPSPTRLLDLRDPPDLLDLPALLACPRERAIQLRKTQAPALAIALTVFMGDQLILAQRDLG